MKDLHCKNCGGAMLPNSTAMVAECLYCGTTYLLEQEDTAYYREFFGQMSSRLSDTECPKPKSRVKTKTQVFSCADGSSMRVEYLYRYSHREADVYVAAGAVVYHFRKQGMEQAEHYERVSSSLDFPSEDVRNLEQFFPKIVSRRRLKDGTYVMVIRKGEDEYPLRLFGALDGRHVAWIISRLENICCVLEYNGLVHPEISVDSVYINPHTHQAFLYGDWWSAGRLYSMPEGRKEPLSSEDSLIALRDTAAALLGFADRTNVWAGAYIPEALAAFVSGEPCEDAYEDFALWDETLIKAYGERKFVKLEVDEKQLYDGTK